jgi:hypothetical protein
MIYVYFLSLYLVCLTESKKSAMIKKSELPNNFINLNNALCYLQYCILVRI